ncbi:hypothetical protein [Microbacterium aurum]
MGLAIILLIVAVVLILLGVFVEAAKFLLWIGLVILLVAIIAWLMRVVKRERLTAGLRRGGTATPWGSRRDRVRPGRRG